MRQHRPLRRAAWTAAALAAALAGTTFAQPTTTPAQPAPTTPTTPKTEPGRTAPAPTPTDPTKPADAPAAAPSDAQQENLVHVQLTTSMGDIVLELDKAKAPISAANFLKYVEKGHYDGTIFHRVIDNFMIQGGGFDATMNQKSTDAPIKNEWQNGLKNLRGTVAMARTNVPDSATSQFFINVKDNAFLDQPNGGAAYAVFGKVIQGMDVVDKIRAVKTGTKNGMGDVPVETVAITKAAKLTPEQSAALQGQPKK